MSQQGEQVNCPGCQHLVKIPQAGEEEQILRPRKSKKYVQAGNAAKTSAAAVRYDRRKPDWERSPEYQAEHVAEDPGGLPWVWIIPAGLIGLGVFAVMLTMVFNSEPVEPDLTGKNQKLVPKDQEKVTLEPVEEVASGYDPVEDSELLEEALAAFLSAKNIEELLKVSRNTPGLEDKMKNYYATHDMEKRDLRELINSASLLDDESRIVYELRLSDYSTKVGNAQKVNGKIYIDWESFVVYSEQGWDKFASEKPTQPVLIRAVSSPSSYYNFDFEDDKWAAFQLTSPVEDLSFVGYVPKSSSLNAKLSPIGGGANMQVVLKVKYPEGAISSNQVIIEDVVQTEWMIDKLEHQK